MLQSCLIAISLCFVGVSFAQNTPFTNSVFERHLNNKNWLREPEILYTCNSTTPCPGQHQVCDLGRCRCPHPTEMYYWSSTGGCEIDAGRPCKPTDGIPCMEDSSCLPDSGSRTGYSCLCNDGMETDGFYCVQSYGQKCRSNYWGGEGCNYSAGQWCILNHCECEYSPDHIFDPVQKRCVAREGYICTTVDFGYLGCVTGTHCAKSHLGSQIALLGECRADEKPMV